MNRIIYHQMLRKAHVLPFINYNVTCNVESQCAQKRLSFCNEMLFETKVKKLFLSTSSFIVKEQR